MQLLLILYSFDALIVRPIIRMHISRGLAVHAAAGAIISDWSLEAARVVRRSL